MRPKRLTPSDVFFSALHVSISVHGLMSQGQNQSRLFSYYALALQDEAPFPV